MASAINGFRTELNILESILPCTKGGGRRPPPFVGPFEYGHMGENTELLSKIPNLVRNPLIAEEMSTF